MLQLEKSKNNGYVIKKGKLFSQNFINLHNIIKLSVNFKIYGELKMISRDSNQLEQQQIRYKGSIKDKKLKSNSGKNGTPQQLFRKIGEDTQWLKSIKKYVMQQKPSTEFSEVFQQECFQSD